MAVGMEAMKTSDTKDGFFGNELSDLLTTWIADNQEKADGIVMTVIGLINDFEGMGNTV